MITEDQPRLQPHARAWLRQSALEAHVSGYCAYLASRGYAPSTRHVYVGCIAHFAHWIRRGRFALKRLDEDAAARYLTEHLLDLPGFSGEPNALAGQLPGTWLRRLRG